MTPIRVEDGLPFVSVTLRHGAGEVTLHRFLLDTGSAGTLVRADLVEPIGLIAELDDEIQRIRGVGGSEFVVTKRVQGIAVGAVSSVDHRIEIGALDYGFDLDGILGFDFLSTTAAKINLGRMEVTGQEE